MKKILKFALYSVLVVLALLLLLAGLTQTQFFRDRLRAAALSQLESHLLAEVRLGELTGNLVSGFSLDNISIKVQNDFLLSAARLDLKYDLFQIPGRIISVDNLTLVHPSVMLLRGRDGVWNFERMIRPGDADTTAATPFDWEIIINKLELQNGTVVFMDSAALAEAGHDPPDPAFVEYHNFTLRDVNLVTSATMRKDEKRTAISSLSFTAENPHFRLERLAGEFSVTPDAASAKNLVIKTGRSFIQIDAEMKDVDLLGGIALANLQNSPVTLSFRGNDIDLDELREFIPQVHFLNGPVTIDLQAGGEFGELNVKRLDLMTGQTSMHFAGAVFNLHHPRDLLLNIKCTESKIFSPDVLALLPSFNLPDYENLGVTTLNFEFYGKPLDFQTKLYLETVAGNVKTDVALKIGGPSTLTYKAEAILQHIDLAQAFADSGLTSRLNGVVEINGKGISIENLQANATARLDSSSFLGRPVDALNVSAESNNRVLSGTVSLAVGSLRSDVKAVLNAQNKETPSFSIDGTVASLNIEDFLHDTTLNSNLTMTIAVQGSGLSWNALNGDFTIGFSPSRFGDYMISSGDVHLLLDQKDPLNKRLALESNIADVSITGAYDLKYLASLISFEIGNLHGAIREKFAALDSSYRTPVAPEKLKHTARTLAASPTTLDASFFLQLKDLEPVSVVAGDKKFNGIGALSGSLKGNYENLELHALLAISDFYYGTVEDGVLLNNASATLDVKDLRPVSPLKNATIRCMVDAQRMHINTNEFDSLAATFSYGKELLTFEAGTTFDRNVRVDIEGQASVSDDEVLFKLNHLGFAYKDFAWNADDGATIGFRSNRVRVRDFVIRRESQSVLLNGDLLSNGGLSATLAASNIDMDGFKYFLLEEDPAADQQSFAGRAEVSLRAAGTLDAPEFTGALRVGNMAYRTIPFGRIEGDFSYKAELLSGRLEMRSGNNQGEPLLAVNGVLPINLALANVEERLPDRPMDVSIKSRGVQMSILDPLLPTFNQLTGIMQCDMKLVGPASKPIYEGTLNIDSCGFLFVPNNIYYAFEGRFQPNGERIKVVEATVRNIPADKRLGRQGMVKITGDFTFSQFKPSDFDLTAKGSLLVVKETTRKSSLSLYGNLFIELGSAGLNYTGNIDNSLLKGYVLISNSSLVFPPTQSSGARSGELFIPTVVVDDTATAAIAPPQDRSLSAQYFGHVDVGPVKPNGNGRNGLPTKSFLEGVHYDLDVESAGGNTEIRMIFFTATGEELVANVTGRVSIQGDGKRWTGDMTIDRAYYNFYKRFEAEGTIKYRGELLNPELDIRAQYQGTRTIPDSTADRTEKVVVTLKITGTRKEPKLDISMTIDDVDYYSYSGPKSADVSSDALQFLIAGNFPLTQSQKNDVASTIGSTVGSSLVTGATSLLSSNLSDFLRRETGFISSIELSYGTQGTFGESADIRVSGVAAGGLWRYGGKILNDPFSNANVSILYSFGKIFDRPSLRNFMFELERRVETSTIGQIGDRKEINSARLFYRFSF